LINENAFGKNGIGCLAEGVLSNAPAFLLQGSV
jgi:hypothetical protein